jgi:hypothetical protein
MNTIVRRVAVVVLLSILPSCGGSGPTSPTRTPSTTLPSPPAPTPPPPATFPPLSGPSRTFGFDRELSHPVSSYTKESRFVLYDTGAFVLQFVGLGIEYRGGYTEANGFIVFEWEGWNIAGPWGATATVNGDSLTVRYNLIMQLTDFEDAVYVRVP